MPRRPTRTATALAAAALTAAAGAGPALADPAGPTDGPSEAPTAETATPSGTAAPDAAATNATATGTDAAATDATAAVPAAGPVTEERERTLFHDGYGVVDIEGRHPASPQELHYVVRVTWSGDGHPAGPETALTATVVGPDGPRSPLALAPLDTDGRFHGQVTFPGPGTWTVRFSAPHPLTTWETVEAVPLVYPPMPYV